MRECVVCAPKAPSFSRRLATLCRSAQQGTHCTALHFARCQRSLRSASEQALPPAIGPTHLCFCLGFVIRPGRKRSSWLAKHIDQLIMATRRGLLSAWRCAPKRQRGDRGGSKGCALSVCLAEHAHTPNTNTINNNNRLAAVAAEAGPSSTRQYSQVRSDTQTRALGFFWHGRSLCQNLRSSPTHTGAPAGRLCRQDHQGHLPGLHRQERHVPLGAGARPSRARRRLDAGSAPHAYGSLSRRQPASECTCCMHCWRDHTQQQTTKHTKHQTNHTKPKQRRSRTARRWSAA